MLQGVCVLDRLLMDSFCSPLPKFLKCPPPLTFFFGLNNVQMKKLEVLRQSFDHKIFLPTCPVMHKSTWLICVCVTDCYCSGERNLDKSFQASKFLFVQSCSILMVQLWTTLVEFIWQKRMPNEPVVFGIWKKRL